jgi:hypothetical protein
MEFLCLREYGKLRARGLPGSASRSKPSRPENFLVALTYQLSSKIFGGDERRRAISMRPSFDAEHEDARAFRMDTFSCTADWLLDRRLRLPTLMPVGRSFSMEADYERARMTLSNFDANRLI